MSEAEVRGSGLQSIPSLTNPSEIDGALYVNVATSHTNFVACQRTHLTRFSYPRIITEPVGEARPCGITTCSAAERAEVFWWSWVSLVQSCWHDEHSRNSSRNV